MAINHVSSEKGSLRFGIMGDVKQIPKNYNIKTILYFSNNGINNAMKEWGSIIRMYNGKPLSQRDNDFTLQYLGYTTDNGMYYYYNTGDYTNYQDVLVAVKDYADSEGIPYRYVLLDSWWYYKGENGGVTDWSARPDVFPQGLSELYAKTGWQVQAHNRYWSNQTVYAKQNGGNYNFLFDSGVMGGAVPLDQKFWDDLFKTAAQWGLKVYEQDWLFNEFYIYVKQMVENVDLGKTWLHQMGKAASLNGLTVQYCMPYVRHLLQSVEIASVTQARASDDYVVYPHEGTPNWRIGGQSLLIEALGLAPSKDGFWSTHRQAKNPYGENRFEPNPSLQALVTTLSTGPVAIGDGIGYSDAKLIMRSCTKDGLILNPSSAATKIDKAMLQKAFGGNGPVGEIWYAPTTIHYRKYGYLFAADVTKSSSLIPIDLDTKLTSNEYWAVMNNDDIHEKVAVKFSSSFPLILKVTKIPEEFNFYVIIPIESNGWAFYGEMSKWVSVSHRRVTNIDTYDNGMSATVTGSTDEEISLAFICPKGKFHITKCSFGLTQVLTIHSNGQCI